MSIYAINEDHNITAFASQEQVDASIPPRGFDAIFASEKEFAKHSAGWPISRFADIWNSFAGQVPFDSLKPVKKFTDRKSAVGRIWKAVQQLTPVVVPGTAPAAPKKAKATKDATATAKTPTAREGSKKNIVLELLKRPDGASLKEIAEATQWQAHSIRGFISGALGKKMGLNVESFKRADDQRAYRVAN